ncbi:transposase [Enterococcus sp. 8G7_MSG3316]|uniref:Transposase n=1 Tax=Candidatus Enterococcus testudinis TaxID=1834191 RepID=A0A242A213_9ENTE|nr:transposase [Enterococcus sp. 8G7_MSG3316]
MNDSIKKLLRITDKNLEITDVSYETVNKKQRIVINATLSPCPQACRSCGSTVKDGFGKTVIVKNGKKMTTIRFDEFNHMPRVMHLKKQRYKCKNCRTYWTAQSYFVLPKHSIASHLRYKIISFLTDKVSLSFIAKHCSVSLSTVIRILRSLKSYVPSNSKKILPEVLMVDEFRSHASSEDKMSFICADGESGQLIDILPTRKLPRLTAYFEKCTNNDQVKFLVTDMNAAYFQLTKTVLPNAKIFIDRFHIVKHMNKAFQDFRVKTMKVLQKKGFKNEAQKLKVNWRSLTKNRQNINHSEYKSWRSFRAPKFPLLTETMMIDRLLTFSSSLREAYEAFHDLADAFRDKDHSLFF